MLAVALSHSSSNNVRFSVAQFNNSTYIAVAYANLEVIQISVQCQGGGQPVCPCSQGCPSTTSCQPNAGCCPTPQPPQRMQMPLLLA